MRWDRTRVSTLGLALALAACTGSIDGTSSGDPAADAGPGQATPDAAPSPGGPLYETLSVPEQELFDTINAERAAAGLVPVTLRDTLICAADNHSADVGPMGSCSHTGSDGSQPGDRVTTCGGGGWTGEIIACGQGTPRSAVDAWINSPGHNAIMFGTSKREIGVAMTNNYWTAIFDD